VVRFVVVGRIAELLPFCFLFSIVVLKWGQYVSSWCVVVYALTETKKVAM
jgi:hypothetical protein